jgi:hypothetical protein
MCSNGGSCTGTVGSRIKLKHPILGVVQNNFLRTTGMFVRTPLGQPDVQVPVHGNSTYSFSEFLRTSNSTNVPQKDSHSIQPESFRWPGGRVASRYVVRLGMVSGGSANSAKC